MHTFYLTAKTFHIIGFIAAIGVTLATFFAYRQFWKLYAHNAEQGLAAFKTFKQLQIIGMLGLMIVLIAGIFMLVVADWAFIQFFWFKVKLILIGLLFVNGFTFGRTSTLELEAFLTNPLRPSEAKKLQNKLRTFQVIQLSIYLVIILLSVFRIE
jgi:hypothetical protein